MTLCAGIGSVRDTGQKQKDSGAELVAHQQAALSLGPSHRFPARKINTFPDELIIFIFTYLLSNDAVCLGLSCRNLYRVLKIFRPNAIPLSDGFTTVEISGRSFQTDPLRDRIRKFIGPEYRISRDGSRFLRREVYGDSFRLNGPESKLVQRYRDFGLVSAGHYSGQMTPWEGEPFFPQPFNAGADWDTKVASLIKSIDFVERKAEWRSNFEDHLHLLKSTKAWKLLDRESRDELKVRESRWRLSAESLSYRELLSPF